MLRNPLNIQLIPLLIAFGSIATFYAHTLLQRPSGELTPAITLLIAVTMLISATNGILKFRIRPYTLFAQQASAVFMFVAIFFQLTSCLYGYLRRPPTIMDSGIFTVQVMTPIFLVFSLSRLKILRYIFRFAVVFAFGDLFVNALTYMGVASLAEISGSNESAYGIHYLGIAGNSFAEGTIAFLAILYVSHGANPSSTRWRLFLRIAVLALLFFSEFLIRARSYFGISAVASALLIFRTSTKVSLIIVSIFISSVLLYATFHHNPYDLDDNLRSILMRRGFSDATRSVVLGDGSRYRATADLIGDYKSLNSAGVTESGALDYVIAYGIPSLICLYISVFFALFAERSRHTTASVLLTCLSGALVISGGLSSYLGAITFYLPIVIGQQRRL